jgi:hypothetical protein
LYLSFAHQAICRYAIPVWDEAEEKSGEAANGNKRGYAAEIS